MNSLLAKAAVSYLLGSVVGSLLIGRLRGGVDIRRLGSGNAGGTNALRTQGKGFAFWVMVIDVGKGWMAAGLIGSLAVPGLEAPAPQWRVWLPCACGIAAIVGHVYPIWYGFRGGKGVATLVGVVIGLDAWLLVPMLLTWFAAVVVVGFVGLASMAAAVSIPLYALLGGAEPRAPLVAFGVAAALIIIFTHRSNVERMFAGTEPRARRLWLLGRRRA